MIFDQAEYEIRCEWGERGAELLAPICDAIVIVDVLSFSTAVSVAVTRGAIIFPYRFRDDSSRAYAASKNALLASGDRSEVHSLSPAALRSIAAGTRLVLPSPNGATISLCTGDTPTYAGCLRNAEAVARAAASHGPHVGVIPCGERWHIDRSLRPSLEDWLGAGAVISALGGRCSPESELARAAFETARDRLKPTLMGCSSGKELSERGSLKDVEVASELGADRVAPQLREGAYQDTA